MNQKQILAVLGSPYRRGTAASMLDEAVKQAEKTGYSVQRLNLYDQNLRFCTGCGACLKTAECIQKDGIAEIAAAFRDCGTVILAAPVYWANVPAPVKNLFDRLRGTAMEETAAFPRGRLKGRKYLLLTCCKTPSPFSWLCGQSRGAIRNMDEFFRTAGMKSAGKIVCANSGGGKPLPPSVVRRIRRCVGRTCPPDTSVKSEVG